MSTTVLCHSRGPSPMVMLAETASAAAVALDFWRLGRAHESYHVSRLLALLVLPENTDAQDPTIIVVLADAFEAWDGHRFMKIRSMNAALESVRKRLRRAADKGVATNRREVATLRNFCLALSKKALAHAG